MITTHQKDLQNSKISFFRAFHRTLVRQGWNSCPCWFLEKTWSNLALLCTSGASTHFTAPVPPLALTTCLTKSTRTCHDVACHSHAITVSDHLWPAPPCHFSSSYSPDPAQAMTRRIPALETPEHARPVAPRNARASPERAWHSP